MKPFLLIFILNEARAYISVRTQTHTELLLYGTVHARSLEVDGYLEEADN